MVKNITYMEKGWGKESEKEEKYGKKESNRRKKREEQRGKDHDGGKQKNDRTVHTGDRKGIAGKPGKEVGNQGGTERDPVRHIRNERTPDGRNAVRGVRIAGRSGDGVLREDGCIETEEENGEVYGNRGRGMRAGGAGRGVHGVSDSEDERNRNDRIELRGDMGTADMGAEEMTWRAWLQSFRRSSRGAGG